ncbi:MAG: beta-lactamase family protein [Clostridia bacterium]|nr:beta-lactamase family protein [Clostridia bacterium]
MKRAAAFFMAFLCLFSSALASEATVEEELNRYFAMYDTLGAVVAVIQNGEVTFTHTYGKTKLGGENVTADTLFQSGSISKMVANIGLMQLITEKNLPLDTPLGELFGFEIAHPGYPQVPVTLRQLMTHTAALRDGGFYQEALGHNGEPLSDVFSKKGEYAFTGSVKPGTKRQYSNFGGGLIGALIEKLSGQTVDGYMRENVFEPLGITAAYQASLIPQDRQLADIYHMPEKTLGKRLRDDDSCITEPDAQTHYFLTAGKLIISAPDLCKLLIALCDGGVYENTRILSESAVKEMTTRQNNIGSVACDSGHGLFMNIITDDQVEGRTMYGHGGKAYGMLCAAYFDPADRTGVVLLTNGCEDDSMHNGVGMLGRVIMRICYNRIVNPTHETENPFAVE